MTLETEVLVIGGSATGMSTALFLAHHGVRCVVVEKKPGPSGHPGFRGISARSMEAYRSAGVEAAIRAVTGEQQRDGYVGKARNMSDPDVTWLVTTPWQEKYAHISPSGFCTCEQDRLEPVLGEHAARMGADIRFATELVSFEQDDRGVRAVVRDVADGTETEVHAAYLVGADGTRSPVREALGIDRTGPGVLEHRVNVMFTTDLAPTLDGRKLTSLLLSDINGALVPRETRPWMISVPYDGRSLSDFTERHCLDLIRKAVGHDDFTAKILDLLPWRPEAMVADTFVDGRVFLAGDAAHVMPPTGAFGGNAGIQDGYNLAWKLAMVIAGTAGPALLDSYEPERKPLIDATVEQALLRLRSWYTDAEKPATLDDNTVAFGYRYHSSALIDAPDELFEDPLEPTASPGSRAPNVTVDGGSILDLFGRGFVLLTASRDWQEAGERAGLDSHRLDADRWTDVYGIGDTGASLVRPDGFVAWRGTDTATDPTAALRDVLDRILHRGQSGA